MATLTGDGPRISVGMARSEFEALQQLARRCNTSVSALGQLAIKHLLIQARNGSVPMLPPSTITALIRAKLPHRRSTAEPMPAITKDTTRISVGVTPAELDEIQRFARRCNMSVSALGQLAVKHLLIQAKDGAVPMLPPSTVKTAEDLTNEELSDTGELVSIDSLFNEMGYSLD